MQPIQDPTRSTTEDAATVAAAAAGDEPAFAQLTERYRPELHLHCYRMLGSLQDAEDLVQETFLRAWRRRDTYAGRSTFRAWLYRIATNASLDALERRPRQVTAEAGLFEVPWLQPYPDALLEPIAAREEEPDAAIVARETIELAFLVAVQHLPPRQRAVLIVRDVLGWSARDTADLLDTSVASVNSALQRARETLRRHLPPQRAQWRAGQDPTAAERDVVQRYVEATERVDVEGLRELIREDARFAMPPEPETYLGRDTMVSAWVEGGFGGPDFNDVRCLVTRANRQPAVANYVRRPGEARHRLFVVDVLRIEEGEIADITTFSGDALRPFDLPRVL